MVELLILRFLFLLLRRRLHLRLLLLLPQLPLFAEQFTPAAPIFVPCSDGSEPCAAAEWSTYDEMLNCGSDTACKDRKAANLTRSCVACASNGTLQTCFPKSMSRPRYPHDVRLQTRGDEGGCVGQGDGGEWLGLLGCASPSQIYFQMISAMRAVFFFCRRCPCRVPSHGFFFPYPTPPLPLREQRQQGTASAVLDFIFVVPFSGCL